MNLRQNPFSYMIQKLWAYSIGNRSRLLIYVGLFVCSNAVTLIEPFIIAKILDIVQAQGVTAQNLPFILLLSLSFIVITLVFWLFHGNGRVLENSNAFLARANYRMFLLDGTLDLPAAWHTDHHSGDTIDKIEKGCSALFEFAKRTFTYMEAIFRLLSAFIILMVFDLHAGVVVVVMVSLTVWIILRFDRVLIPQYQQISRFENGISAKIFDIISNVTTVIILRIERLVLRSIDKKVHEPYSLYQKQNKLNELKWFLVSLCASVMVVLILCSYFFWHVHYGIAITIGTVYILYSYAQRISSTFYSFAYNYGDLVRYRTQMLNAEELTEDFRTKRRESGRYLVSNWGVLSIRDLSFSYHSKDGMDLHLESVSMDIKHGERIALIGESGSGKTTFLKILRGLYDPRTVKVELDGKILPRGLEAISAQIALIPQDPEIFATTIEENVTVGVSYPQTTLRKFADMARFTDVVSRLPKKWESSIVEKGVNLSGGEKQRLALARGLLACVDKTIVLLDEPTSSVDTRNESAIYENIFKSFKEKTVISSIHRLHLLHLFDTIYLFENGSIVASGSLKTLLQTSAKFQDLWKKYQQTSEKMKE